MRTKPSPGWARTVVDRVKSSETRAGGVRLAYLELFVELLAAADGPVASIPVLGKHRRTKGIPLVEGSAALQLQVKFPDFSSMWTLTSSQAEPMIRRTRLNHVPMIVNADLIEHIDMTPDTVVTLTSGQK